MINIRPVVSAPLAGCCSVLSVFGVIILCAVLPFGWFFDHNVEALMGSTKDPLDGHAVAVTCYTAAIIYVAFIVFCGCQMGIHNRYPRGVQL
ncbi:hypothetical protein [Phaffia rhodozyma]|uniref:Uncharacterized protein n=1 Tax=Phaffia rhodozyma TaxID=264483 RepID=A0A0F7STR9_PHARH|nr:hypothetical protein [Phaffia rhodozyma]